MRSHNSDERAPVTKMFGTQVEAEQQCEGVRDPSCREERCRGEVVDDKGYSGRDRRRDQHARVMQEVSAQRRGASHCTDARRQPRIRRSSVTGLIARSALERSTRRRLSATISADHARAARPTGPVRSAPASPRRQIGRDEPRAELEGAGPSLWGERTWPTDATARLPRRGQ